MFKFKVDGMTYEAPNHSLTGSQVKAYAQGDPSFTLELLPESYPSSESHRIIEDDETVFIAVEPLRHFSLVPHAHM